MTKLSEISPDFETLVDQLRQVLSRRDSWKDLYESSTGQTLIEFQAGVGTMLHFALERAIQEVFMVTANLPSSVYANARMLGVNPQRKVSAKVTAALNLNSSHSSNVSIPALSRFDVNGIAFYTPELITFAAGDTEVSVGLVQGEIVDQSFTGTGRNFQIYEFSSGFEANQDLMQVKVDGEEYEREFESLWKRGSGELVFLEQTLPDGSVRIVFGNSNFGSFPGLGSDIRVTWARSLGSSVNTATSSLEIRLLDSITVDSDLVDVSGVTTTAIANGSDQDDPDVIRWTAPRLFAAGDRAIRRDDWRAVSVNWHGTRIADANAVGEYELESTDVTLMNNMTLVILPRESEMYGPNALDEAGNGTRTDFTADLTDLPVEKGSVIVENVGVEKFSDDGDGNLISFIETKDEVQEISTTASSGNFTLTFGGQTTADIAYNASASTLQSRLNALTSIGANGVEVSGGEGFPWRVVFSGNDLDDAPQSLMTVSDTSNYSVERITAGVSRGSGTVDYDTGSVSITFAVAPVAGSTLTVTHSTNGLTSAQGDEFRQYIDDYKHVTTLISLRDPEALVTDITARVGYLRGFFLAEVEEEVRAALVDLFARKIGTLGKAVEISDILSSIQSAPGVDYCTMSAPTDGVECEYYQYAKLGRLRLTLEASER